MSDHLLTSLRLNNDVPVDEFVELAQLAESLRVRPDLGLQRPVLPVRPGAPRGRGRRRPRTIALGTCVLNPYSVHPAEIAMIAATLQELSGGRFLLGLAAGADDFLGWAGITRDAPLARTREAVVAIRALCSGRLARRRSRQRRRTGDRDARLRVAAAADADLPRGDVTTDAGVDRRDRRRRAPAALPAGVVRRHDDAHRRRSRPVRPAARATSTSPRASGCRSTTTPSGLAGRWPRSSPTTARRSRRRCSPGSELTRPTLARPPQRRPRRGGRLAPSGDDGAGGERHSRRGRRALPPPRRGRSAPRVVRTAARTGSSNGGAPARRTGRFHSCRTCASLPAREGGLR